MFCHGSWFFVMLETCKKIFLQVLCEAESSVFFQLGLDAPLGAGFAIFVAAIVQHGARSCGLSGFRFWVHISSPFLGPAILTHAAEVPFLGPQSGPQFRAKSRALNALLGRLFEFFLQSI